MTKPFAFSALLARINTITPRARNAGEPFRLNFADLEMDLIRRSATRKGDQIELRQQEFLLLEFLMRNEDRLVTRSMLLEHMWALHFDPRTNVVETHISRLRALLGISCTASPR